MSNGTLLPPRTAKRLSFEELGLDVAVELITPEVATEYLRFNDHNRREKDLQIQLIMGAILRDEWMLNGETIVFSRPDKDGKVHLLDGQNRLRSIEEAGTKEPEQEVALPAVVIRGVDPEALYTIDGVVKRSVADALNLEGYSNTTNLAAATNLIHCWEIGETALRSKSKYRLTPMQAVGVVKNRPDILVAVREAERIHRKMMGLVPQSLVAACWWKFASIDESDCTDFFASLATGENLQSGDPIYALRRALARNYSSTTKRNPLVIHAWIIKAWNYFRGHQRVDSISWRAVEPFPDAA